MNETASGSGSCYLCWADKHKCDRITLQGPCANCRKHLPRRINDVQGALINPPEFPHQLIDEQFRAEGWTDPLNSLDTSFPNTTTCYIDFRRSSPSTKLDLSPRLVQATLENASPFTHQNPGLADKFDKLIFSNFSAKLEAKDEASPLIYYAALAGGYLRLLSTTVALGAQLRISLDGIPLEVELAGSDVDSHVRRFCFYRLRDLIMTIMTSVRFDGSFNTQKRSSSIAHAAAAILQFEIEHAKSGLRTGAFSEHVRSVDEPAPKRPFLDWLGEIAAELTIHLAWGCGKYSTWRDVLDGSTKQLRRPAEEISIVAHLFQARFSPEPQNNSSVSPNSPPISPRSQLPICRLVPRKPLYRNQSMNPNSVSYFTPATTEPNPPSNIANSSIANQTNRLVRPNATYGATSRPNPQSQRSFQDGSPSTWADVHWAGAAIEAQNSSQLVLNHETSGSLQLQSNPFPMFIFRGQDHPNATIPEYQAPLNSFQSQEDIQAEEFSESSFPFVNSRDVETAGANALIDDLFPYF